MLFRDKGAIMLDLEGRIEFASSHFCGLVGGTLDEIFAKFFVDLVFPEDVGNARTMLESIKQPESPSFQFRLRRMDGAHVWVDIVGGPLRTAVGEIYGTTATVTAAKLE